MHAVALSLITSSVDHFNDNISYFKIVLAPHAPYRRSNYSYAPPGVLHASSIHKLYLILYMQLINTAMTQNE